MKFNEKILSIRKKQGLSQEELSIELEVSRQTISKWESGQSYPDFQKLVMLSDFFNITFAELVKDIDLQDIREKNLTDEKISSIFSDIEKSKEMSKKWIKLLCYVGFVILGIFALVFILHLIFPDISFLWVVEK